METVNGAMTADQKYFGYSTQRDNGKVTTDHRFTGQKEDGSGLQFYDARYAVEPDHLSTDQTKFFDDNFVAHQL